MTTLTPPWLTRPEVQQMFTALGAPAVDVRAVGGSVRDGLLGRDRPDSEIDVGTPETPDRVIGRLGAAKIKAIPTGIDHGTVTAIVGDKKFEITSLRRDTACDGRHAAVEFTTDWQEDARRRDFTMNAMSLTPTGVLHDYHHGADDARAGRVRFVGDANDRIREDYLRILRLFRFTALYGREPIDAATLAACAAHTGGIARLSAERVHDEMMKLLAAPDPVAAVTQMAVAGVLDAVVPGHRGVDVLSRLVAAENQSGVNDRVWTRRLAALISANACAATAARLKLSNADIEKLRGAVNRALTPATDSLSFRRALYHEGAAILDSLLVSWAASGSDGAAWSALVANVRAWSPRPLPVSGGDVLAQGIAPGPAVGRILADLTEWWIAADFQPSRTDALAELARRVPPKR